MMKTISIFLIVSLYLGLYTSCTCEQKIDLNQFATNLASTNVKLRGTLLLEDYEDDLSKLTFDQYINYLKIHETPSSKGLDKIIQKTENHFFVAKKNTFQLVLYNKKLNAIVFDDANTFGVDSVIILSKNEKIPDLKSFIKD